MIETFSVLTITLTRAFAIYIIATSFAGLTDPKRWAGMVADMQASPGLTHILGLVTFVIGLALVVLHSLWTDTLAILVSLIAWAALVEGAILLAAPVALLKLAAALVEPPRRARAFALIGLVAGAFLLGLGLVARANAGV